MLNSLAWYCAKFNFYNLGASDIRHQCDFPWLNFSSRGPHSLQGYLRGAADETPAPRSLYHIRGWLPKFGGRAFTTAGVAIVRRFGNRGGFRRHRHSLLEHTDNRRCRCGLIDISRLPTNVHGTDDTDVRRTLQYRRKHAAAAKSAASSAGPATHIAGKFGARTAINIINLYFYRITHRHDTCHRALSFALRITSFSSLISSSWER